MKTYMKPEMEKVSSQTESHILAGSVLNNEKGDGSQLAKRQLDLFLDEDFSTTEEYQ